MKKQTIILAAASAAVLLVAASAKPAFAYFTKSVSASGQQTLDLGYSQELIETYDDGVKNVVITNTDDMPVYVRVTAFAPESYNLEYSGDANWTPGSDGYYYYALPLDPASDAYDTDSTTTLDITIRIPEGSTESFDVVVVYEAVPVSYDEDGNPYADWTLPVEEGEVR